MGEAGRVLGHRRVAKGTGGCLKLLVCSLLTTISFLGRRIDSNASLGGCVARVSSGEGETTPDRITVLADTLK
jgi:hypothetical protein